MGASGVVSFRCSTTLAIILWASCARGINSTRSANEMENPAWGTSKASLPRHSMGPTRSSLPRGPGGSTGWDKTILVDLWGAERAVRACEEHGINRFVMISSRGAGDPESRQGPIKPYIVAKHVADRTLQRSSLDETILRPTRLTDEEGTGRVAAYFDTDPETGDPIPRADVAQAVVQCLGDENTVGHAITLYGGDTPIEEALRPSG